jgi:DNA-binding NarL/FixJ family response regulator
MKQARITLSKSMKTTTIIVDDHSLFNDGLRLILRESEIFEVIEQIYDSRDTYQKCLELKPALIIVDYNMPHLSGLEVVKQLQNLDYNKKVVIVSMYADKKEIALFEEAGVNGYFTKTTPTNILVESLKKIMNGEKVIVANNFNKATTDTDNLAKRYKLTKREIEIVKLVGKSYTSEQIASALNLSFYTVETHRKNINQKLNFESKQEFYEFLRELV